MSEVDVRCSASLNRLAARQGRCQLLMGHDGSHAVMFSLGQRRVVRYWHHHDTDEAEDRVMDIQRPWMRGFPMPAWAERAITADV